MGRIININTYKIIKDKNWKSIWYCSTKQVKVRNYIEDILENEKSFKFPLTQKLWYRRTKKRQKGINQEQLRNYRFKINKQPYERNTGFFYKKTNFHTGYIRRNWINDKKTFKNKILKKNYKKQVR